MGQCWMVKTWRQPQGESWTQVYGCFKYQAQKQVQDQIQSKRTGTVALFSSATGKQVSE